MAQPRDEVATAISFTGRMCAASRHLESSRSDALFTDPLAGKLAGMRGMQQPMGDWILVPRTRFGDDVLRTAYEQKGARQLVLLGAGMDTRAFRVPLPDLRVFEVDQQTTFDVKEPLLEGEPLSVLSRHIVGVDFVNPAGQTNDKCEHGPPIWEEFLLESGFDSNIPTVWLLEGLVMYLPEGAVLEMMSRIGGLSAPNSVVFHDAISASYVQVGVRVAGEPFISGSDDYSGLWSEHGGFRRNSRAIDFSSIHMNRKTRSLDVDETRPLVTPAIGRGRNIVIFFQAEK